MTTAKKLVSISDLNILKRRLMGVGSQLPATLLAMLTQPISENRRRIRRMIKTETPNTYRGEIIFLFLPISERKIASFVAVY